MSSWPRLLANPRTRYLLPTSFLLFLAFAIGDSCDVIFLRDYFKFTQEDMSNVMATVATSALLMTPALPLFIGYLGAQLSYLWGVVGMSLLTIFFVLGALSAIRWVPIAVFSLSVGFFGSLASISYMEVIRRRCPEDSLVDMFTIENILINAAGMIGSLLGGAGYSHNHFLPFVVKICCFLGVAFLFWLTLYKASDEKDLPLPTVPKSPSQTDQKEEEEGTPQMLAPMPYSKSTLYLSMLTNEYKLTHDDLLSVFHKKNRTRVDIHGHLQRAATIGGDSFSQFVDKAKNEAVVEDAFGRFRQAKTLSATQKHE